MTELTMKSLMVGKTLIGSAQEITEKLTAQLTEARNTFCGMGDKCDAGSDAQNEHYDNRELVSEMKAEALKANAALERMRMLGGKIVIAGTRGGNT